MPTKTMNPKEDATQLLTQSRSNHYHQFWILLQLLCLTTVFVLLFASRFPVTQKGFLTASLAFYFIINSIVYIKLYYKNKSIRNQISKQINGFKGSSFGQ